MKKYLVTGATGFVGSWVTRALIEKGNDVHILVRNRNIDRRLIDLEKKLNIHVCDLQSDNLQNVINKIKPNIVFHLAAAGASPNKQENIHSLIDANVQGLANLIDAVKKHDVDLFVNTGSSSEYGIKSLPMQEIDVLAPINDYGVSKAAATLYAQRIAKVEGFPIITLRLFSPYGYYDAKERLISYVIEQAVKNEPISLSSKNHVRDFIYIEDVINAYFAAEKIKVTPGDIINIGSGQQCSVYDIVKHIIALTNSNSEIEWGSMPKQTRQVEPTVWQADITKAKRVLSWQPQYSLQEGLQRTISYFTK
jgi:nucleoside-diphosphate-sugar epimerase